MNLYYLRVSSKDQNLDRQLQAFNIDINDKGVYYDKSSGKTTDRPELNRLLKDARGGDILHCMDLSRLGRNLKQVKDVLEKLHNCGVTVKFNEDVIKEVDPNDPSSTLILNVILSVYEFERTKKVNLIQQGIEAKKDKDGYIKNLKPDSYKKYKEITELISKGYNVAKACEYVSVKRTMFYYWKKQIKEA